MSAWIVRLGAFDERLLHLMVRRRRPFLDGFMRSVTHLADWPVAVGVSLTLALGAVPSLAGEGVRAAWALALSHLGVEILKRLFTRERPRLPVGLAWLVTVPDRFSFPSGHATAALAMALPLASGLPLTAGTLVLLLAAAVGVSRCYLGVHYPGDVLAGWALASSTTLALGAVGV
jgi:undecaprenyl-diphosphatase